jgi:hypothetical protein
MPLRSFTEAEIALMARRRLERPLLATLWLGVVMFALAEGNAFYGLAGTLAVGINLLAVERRREVSVHRLWVNMAVLVALLILVLEVRVRGVFLPAALAHFIVLIQVCKLFERKTNRDYVQMLALSVLTVVVGALLSQAIWFAFLLAGYLVLVSYSAMILTLKRGLDSAATVRLVCESAPLSASRVAWNVIRDWPGRAVAGKLAAVLALSAAAAVAVFFVAPREQAGGSALLGSLGEADQTASVQEVRLGRPRRVLLSGRIVMRVACQEGAVARTASLRYFRGQAMDSYDGFIWRDMSELMERILPTTEPPLRRGVARLEVTMDPSLLPRLFAPYRVLHWEVTGGALWLREDKTVSFFRDSKVDSPVRYRVDVPTDPFLDTSRAAPAGNVVPGRADWPSGRVKVSRRVADLARQWCRDLLIARQADPAGRGRWDLAIAQRLAEKLKQDYAYSLDLSSANPDRDGVEDFLFSMRQGHCEYFASALTVMCRALDVPARLATGFLVDEYDASTDNYVVREWDAHAWTEVYAQGLGWVNVDATPARVDRWSRQGWWRKVDDFLARLNFRWYTRIVGYDVGTQQRLLGSIASLAQRVWGFLRAMALATGRGFVNLLVHGYIDQAMVRASIVLGMAAGVLEAMLLLRLRRRKRRRARSSAALAAQPWGPLAFIPALLDRLERLGLDAQADRTAMQTAWRAVEVFRLPAAPLTELVALYYRARWGGCPPNEKEVTTARRQADLLKDLLALAGGQGAAAARV